MCLIDVHGWAFPTVRKSTKLVSNRKIGRMGGGAWEQVGFNINYFYKTPKIGGVGFMNIYERLTVGVCYHGVFGVAQLRPKARRWMQPFSLFL